MKVFYDYQIFSIHARGGIAKYFAQLSLLMGSAGWEPYLPFRFCLNRHYFDMGGDSLIQMPSFKWDARLCRVLNEWSVPDHSKYRVWHSTYYDAELIEKYGSDRLVSTVHDMIPELYPDYFSGNPHRDKKLYVQKSQRIIAISKQTREDICKVYGVDRSKIDVVYHGIDTKDLSTRAMALPERYILYIGSRVSYKNFERLLIAFKKLSERHRDLALLCLGGRSFSVEETRQIRELELTRVVSAQADDAQLRYAMKNAAAFVFPSIYEGFGIPILEAMAQRCPMAISNTSCFPEIAKDCAVYFDPFDVESIAHSLDVLLGDWRGRERRVERGSSLVKTYSLSEMIRRTSEVYERIVR